MLHTLASIVLLLVAVPQEKDAATKPAAGQDKKEPAAKVAAPIPLPTAGKNDATKVIEPSPVPISWELELKYLDPRRIDIQLPGSDKPQVFWYMVYTVTNPNQQSRRFYPICQFVTDELKIYNMDVGISPLVFDAIKERHKITHKYLVHPTKAVGALLSGDDNARESVAVWRDVDMPPSVNGFRIYVAGLSGETRLVPNPKYDPKQPEVRLVKDEGGREREEPVNPKAFTLRKTLELKYNLPGSPEARATVDAERGDMRWIMR